MQPSLADRPTHRARFAILGAAVVTTVSLLFALAPRHHHHHDDGRLLSGRCHYHARY
jgi:hypothetical protein